jgi:hypothetical protein
VASKRALKGVDLAAVDPLEVLRSIAADISAPANARLQAARTLLARGGKKEEEGDAAELDRVSQRALVLLKGGRK